MNEFFGIILLDHTEIILRVYQTDGKEWRLFNYFRKGMNEHIATVDKSTTTLAKQIMEILSSSYTQQVISWKLCSKGIATETIEQVAKAIELDIEPLTHQREQELLSKGMFTELW